VTVSSLTRYSMIKGGIDAFNALTRRHI
jgi:hypothetical protein